MSGTVRTGLEGHAVVVGGGIAGLMAARALSDHFAEVTIIERDELPQAAQLRRGTPQAVHVHGLLASGLREMESSMPGFTRDMVSAGATPMDQGRDFWVFSKFGVSTPFKAGVESVTATRSLIEWTLRRHVSDRPGVTVLQRHTATGLVRGSGDRVTGVRVSDARGDETRTVAADLVVDSAGRGSRLPTWLAELGYEAPPETVIDPRIGYASRMFRIPEGWSAPWTTYYVQLGVEQTRGAIMTPIEGGRWLATLIGIAGDRPSTEEADFLPFLRSLPDQEIARAVASAQPLSGVYGSHTTHNQRRHYEKLTRQPDNVIALGDSACCFNPIYGQGMSNASLCARLLGECLEPRTGRSDGDLTGFARSFHRRLGRLNDVCWRMSTGADIRLPATIGPAPTRADLLFHRYFDRLLAATNHDATVRLAFLETVNMLKPPTWIMRPSIVVRVLLRGSSAKPGTPVIAEVAAG